MNETLVSLTPALSRGERTLCAPLLIIKVDWVGALVDTTEWLRQVYIDTAHDTGFKPGPQHFGYLLRCLVADTDAKAVELGREFMWTRRMDTGENPDRSGFYNAGLVHA